MTTKQLRDKAEQYADGNRDKFDAFIAGYQFAIHGKFYKEGNVFITTQDDYYPCKEALDTWLSYKAEKNQRYKPRGLDALKKKLIQLSNGNPEFAKEIVEYSMANNYAGLFAPKDSNYGKQKHNADKLSAIFTD